jgi:hypothetical protein
MCSKERETERERERERDERKGEINAYTNDRKEKNGLREKLICLCFEKFCTNNNIRIEIFLSFFPWCYCQTKSLFNKKKEHVFHL